jgi:hypothetical protein
MGTCFYRGAAGAEKQGRRLAAILSMHSAQRHLQLLALLTYSRHLTAYSPSPLPLLGFFFADRMGVLRQSAHDPAVFWSK